MYPVKGNSKKMEIKESQKGEENISIEKLECPLFVDKRSGGEGKGAQRRETLQNGHS